MGKLKLIAEGIIKNNPTFVLILGMCPTLGTTTSAINGMGMGLATLFVLVLSNITISAIAKLIPEQVRIPSYIVVIAAFVTIVQLLLQAFLPSLYETLGLFIPLIVVNCIVLGRAEAYANKNSVIDSAFDGLGVGLGLQLPWPFSALYVGSAVVRSLVEIHRWRWNTRIRSCGRIYSACIPHSIFRKVALKGITMEYHYHNIRRICRNILLSQFLIMSLPRSIQEGQYRSPCGAVTFVIALNLVTTCSSTMCYP